MRTGRVLQSASSRSSDNARCAPRLSRATAWISSTIAVRTVDSMRRPLSEVSSTYSDSGVVTRTCGGALTIRWRSACAVSPVRTAVRMSGTPAARSSASGSSRFLRTSFASALRGETYTTWVAASRPPDWSASRKRRSRQTRKAARVLPEPVGAAMSVSSPAWIRGQPAACGSVGVPKRRWNQSATVGWKPGSTAGVYSGPLT